MIFLDWAKRVSLIFALVIILVASIVLIRLVLLNSVEEETNFLEKENLDCFITSCLPTSTLDFCAEDSHDNQIKFQKVAEKFILGVNSSEIECVISVCCRPNSTATLLASISKAEENEFPHQVSFMSDKGLCAATIYNRRYLITAAHCIVHGQIGQITNASSIKVSVGSNFATRNMPQFMYRVKRVIPHPEYGHLNTSLEWRKNPDANKRRVVNDIALLELDRNISFGKSVKALEIVPIGFEPTKHASSVVVVGWGVSDTLKTTQWLQKSNFVIRPTKRCLEIHSNELQNYTELPEQFLCAGGFLDGQWSPVAGRGDSGSAAICRDENGHPVLCGIVSSGGNDAHCRENWDEENCLPTIFAKVAYYHDWIVKVAGVQEEKTLYKPFLYGQTVDWNKYPHQVRIRSPELSCGGTLIQPDVVLTTSSCVYNKNGTVRNFTISSYQFAQVTNDKGSNTAARKKRALVNAVQQVQNVLNDKYTPHENLAVILLKQSIGIPTKQLPRLPNPGEVFARGLELSFNSFGKFMCREYKLLNRTKCQTRMDQLENVKNVTLEYNNNSNNNSLCGVDTYSGGSTCDRDYGGGLLCPGKDERAVLCGVQTFRSCSFSIPNGFMDVELQRDWIETTIQKLRRSAMMRKLQ